ncbi:efflux transporter outer membrane subunit [Sulfurirhabdus autotrophica]|uniref:Multidrug efflux system outer membrane protein n=1 Tax=Sulfurirhabdus autotrophica TaxID=1706046 RepID=A0A4R3YER2_9PROT|nr:efflux transporter outer membrane subunit [Sulfurirhabdus autotrophica]TCV90570.1 multidrug efflux system outer membrane protein [Sulfurirhabdus autotrophica]
MNKVLPSLLAVLIVSGCATGPDYQRPDIDLPQQWSAQTGPAKSADVAGKRWWSLYADPVLDKLIDEALLNNADVQVAAARVLEARAQAGLTDADRYPSVSASIGVNRTQSTLRGSFPRPADLSRTQNSYRATLDASYEVDLWGKYSRASEAARADLLSAESAREAVRLSLTAQIAQQYFALIAADAQEAIARRTLATRSETLALNRKRLESGSISEYELYQTVAEEANIRAQLAALTESRVKAESLLAMLSGRSPRDILSGNVVLGKPAAVQEVIVPAGLPSELLLRRPDLAEAEQKLIAANARIGAARAQYFPSVGLTAYLGSESTSFSNLFTGPAGIFQFAAILTQPIWNANRIGLGVDISEARRDQALAQYRQAVANAFKDVRDALASQTASKESLNAQSSRSKALESALSQAQLRYNAGISSRLEVLDVERNLLQAELAKADAELASKVALANLFKALGGGWGKESDVTTAE